MNRIFESLIDLAKIFSLMLPAIGSYFWIRRNIWSSARSIYDISRTKYGYSTHLSDELCAQKADSFVALIYIVSGAISQAILFFIPIERPFASPLRLNWLNLIFALGTYLVFKRVGNSYSRWFERRLIKEIRAMAEARRKK